MFRVSSRGLVSTLLICALLGLTPASAVPATQAAVSGASLDSIDLSELAAVSDPPVLSQHAYVKAFNPDDIDNFGADLALSGDTLVVGAPGEDSETTGVDGTSNEAAGNSGAAYVFVRTDGVWSQQAFLKASNVDDDGGDEFGGAVAISGDTIVVGADEEDSNATMVDGDETNNTAFSSGAAYVFVRTDGVWAQQAYLKASNAEQADHFGISVAVDGDTVVVGAHFENSNDTGVNGDEANNDAADSGAAYIFVRNAGVWSQQAYVKASNTEFQDQFGVSVDISGDTAVIGANNEDSSATGVNGNETLNNGENSGAAYVFLRSGVNWTQQAYLKASNTTIAGASDQFATSVAISGETILVGAPSEDSNATGVGGDQANNLVQQSGAAYVFTRSVTTWTQQAYLKASNTGLNDQFGVDVGLDGDVALIGALNEDSDSVGLNGPDDNDDAGDSGAAYVYRRSGSTWSFGDYLKASNADPGDLFGFDVAVSGSTLAVAASPEASDATGVNGDEEDDSLPFSGAAYVFGPPCATAPFTDVPTNHTFCAEIEWMKQSDISTGFMDGSYGPGSAVTRQAMSAFMARFADATLTPCTEPPFTDVPEDHQFCEEIKWMKESGISLGFGNGSYGPGLAVTRQAMSAFMARLAEATLTACTVAPFNDVPTDHAFCEEIQWMKETGISLGFGNGTYGPNLVVTRQAMSAFIYRLNNLLNHF